MGNNSLMVTQALMKLNAVLNYCSSLPAAYLITSNSQRSNFGIIFLRHNTFGCHEHKFSINSLSSDLIL